MKNNFLIMLAKSKGITVDQMLSDAMSDSVAPAICKSEGCGHVTTMEPDQDGGYCEKCGNNTVVSCLVLAGVI